MVRVNFIFKNDKDLLKLFDFRGILYYRVSYAIPYLPSSQLYAMDRNQIVVTFLSVILLITGNQSPTRREMIQPEFIISLQCSLCFSPVLYNQCYFVLHLFYITCIFSESLIPSRKVTLLMFYSLTQTAHILLIHNSYKGLILI